MNSILQAHQSSSQGICIRSRMCRSTHNTQDFGASRLLFPENQFMTNPMQLVERPLCQKIILQQLLAQVCCPANFVAALQATKGTLPSHCLPAGCAARQQDCRAATHSARPWGLMQKPSHSWVYRICRHQPRFVQQALNNFQPQCLCALLLVAWLLCPLCRSRRDLLDECKL